MEESRWVFTGLTMKTTLQKTIKECAFCISVTFPSSSNVANKEWNHEIILKNCEILRTEMPKNQVKAAAIANH